MTLLETRFDPELGCRSCGNTGIGLNGRFCKCPHGRKSPPAQLHEGIVLQDVGPISFRPDGKSLPPRLKLGIRGPYVYEACGLHRVANPAWAHTYTAYAAMGQTLAGVLETVETKAPSSNVGGLLSAMPEILAAVMGAFDVDLVEESRQAAEAVYTTDHLRADGVVYTLSTDIGADAFMSWLDIAGYDGVACDGDGLRASQVRMRAFLSHSRRLVRVTTYHSSSKVGFDGLIKLRREVPQQREPSGALTTI